MTHIIQVYPHNDLLNVAHYHLSIINEKVAHGNNDALSLDCISCLTSLAFGVEAFINFVGSKVVPKWKERQPFIDKLTSVYGQIGGSFDKNSDPYKTIWELKELRDDLAHGKPIEKEIDTTSKEDLWSEMKAPWDHRLNIDYANHSYEQVKIWQRELLDRSGISIDETITAAHRK